MTISYNWRVNYIHESCPQYFINENNEFLNHYIDYRPVLAELRSYPAIDSYNHYIEYQPVLAELQTNHTIDLAKQSLASIGKNVGERDTFISMKATEYISPYKVQEMNWIAKRLGTIEPSQITPDIIKNSDFVEQSIGSQVRDLKIGTIWGYEEEFYHLTYHMGKCLQDLTCYQLDSLQQIADSNEMFALLTLEPIFLTKIGVTIVLKNWIVLHAPGMFNFVLNKVYQYNPIIEDKINRQLTECPFFNVGPDEIVDSNTKSNLKKILNLPKQA